MKRYEAYKDTGVEWLGEIPAHWDVKRLKYSGIVQPSNVDKKKEEGEIPVQLCNYIDVYKNEFIEDSLDFMEATATEDEISKFKINIDDVLVTKDSESADDIAVPALVKIERENLICGYHLTQIKPNAKELIGSFLFRLFQENLFKSQFTVYANGVTRFGLSVARFKDAFITLPPLAEQTSIAQFLDRKTSQIDSLVEKKKRLIELLKEEKTAVINQAVTKGIDPNVKMKDSGVEWLGEIPEHWEVKKLGHLGKCQNGISISAESFGSGFPFVSYGDVYKNFSLPTSVSGLVESNDAERNQYSVKSGDVFFTRTSETSEEIGLASTCFYDIPDATFAGFLIRFRPDKEVLDSNFSKFYFRSQLHRFYFVKEMNLVTRASLSQGLLKRLPVLLPPLSEQQIIGETIDKKIDKIDITISKIEKEIELLKEYRTALISEVVTGKVKVDG